MNTSRVEVTWLARIIRLFGFKELFDFVTNSIIAALRLSGSSAVPSRGGLDANKDIFWAILSLVIALLLFRSARNLAIFLIGPAGSRPIARTLNAADSVWFSIGLRAFGVWFVLTSIGYAVQAFFYAAGDPAVLATKPGAAVATYAVWTIVYGAVGATLCRRPDVVGIFLMSSAATQKSG